jgi:ketosteroid isomerase-like protein
VNAKFKRGYYQFLMYARELLHKTACYSGASSALLGLALRPTSSLICRFVARSSRRDRRPFGASSVAHRCAQVVHAWIASSAGITMPVNQFPLSVLPSVDLGDAKVYRLRGTADDRSRASFEADQVCQIPADSGSQDFEVDWCPVRVQRGDAAEGLANLCPSELAGFERQRRAGGAATCGRPRRCPPGSMATTASGVKPNFRGAPRPPRISGSDIPAPEKEMPQSPGRRAMSDREEFVAWTQSRLRGAETALHNGDPAPRLAIWSTREPVSVLGAWRSAVGQEALRDLFHYLAETFSNCTSHVYEIVAADVVGDMAFTGGYERTQASVNGEPRRYVLRVTQVYRREDGEWKVAHRHADTVPESEEASSER